jgi:hypothetical protein
MTILHSGTSRDYASNWEQAFGKIRKKKAAAPRATVKKQASKKKRPKRK